MSQEEEKEEEKKGEEETTRCPECEGVYDGNESCNWILCDGENCNRWYHDHCVGLENDSIQSIESKTWLCSYCVVSEEPYVADITPQR